MAALESSGGEADGRDCFLHAMEGLNTRSHKHDERLRDGAGGCFCTTVVSTRSRQG